MNPVSSRKRPRHDSDTGARALTNGLRRGKSQWSQEGQQAMASLSLALHAAHRRTELQASCRQLDAQISQLDERFMDQAFKRFGAKPLMTH
jgi:hypothetical protein